MKTIDQLRMFNYLLEQQQKGMNWVGFSGLIPPSSPSYYKGFKSSIDAHHFCKGESFANEPPDGSKFERLRSYVAIGNFLHALKHHLSGKIEVITDLKTIRSEMERLGAHFPDSSLSSRLSIHLAAGDIIMAGLTYPITPADQVDKFFIVRHSSLQHKGRQVERLDTAPLSGRSNQEDIASAWENGMQWLKYQRHVGDHTWRIIGGFHNVDLKLSNRGEPIRNTGVQLMVGNQSQGILSVNGSLDLQQQIPVVQYVFLQFDPAKNRLQVLDDELQPVSKGTKLESFASFDYTDICANTSTKAAKKLLDSKSLVRKREVQVRSGRKGLRS